MEEMSSIYQYIPEPLLRFGIRRLCQQRLNEQEKLYANHQHLTKVITDLKNSPIALSTDLANNQHYQVPTEFFKHVLGKHLKYSCCLWHHDTQTLDEAETNMLQLYCERAGLTDGMKVLDLGCGWGSLSLYLAEQYPNMEITALSNSNTQRQLIESQGYKNLTVITSDINDFDTESHFDAVISIEMFEHVRNYQVLMQRIYRWLSSNGVCFVHHFCHKSFTYPFALEEDHNWMAKYFFTDGLMPSSDLLEQFSGEFEVAEQWEVNGLHYHLTCEAWLEKHKQHKSAIIDIFSKTLSPQAAKLQWRYWQIFFLACSELFAFNNGNEWFVKHYLFRK